MEYRRVLGFILLLILLTPIPMGSLADTDKWTQVAPKLGTGMRIYSLAVYNGHLYGGTGANGGMLYQWNDVDAWVQVAPKLGTQTEIHSLVVYNGHLYGGTGNSGFLYRWNDVDAWVKVASTLPEGWNIFSLAVYNGHLYGGTVTNGRLYQWNDVDAWVSVASMFGAEGYIYSLAVYNGHLYGGTSGHGCLLQWNDVDAWVQVAPSNAEIAIFSLAVYNGHLYGGTGSNGRLYQWNDVDAWVQVAPKLGTETEIRSLAVYNGHLYGGTGGNGKLYQWNDVDAWVSVAPMFGAETFIFSLAVYNGCLYGGTGDNGNLYEWGPDNSLPVNDACDSSATFYLGTNGWVNVTVTDLDLVADLKTVDIQMNTTGDAQTFTLRWTQATGLFSEVSDASNICTLGSSVRANIDADTDKIAFQFKFTGGTSGACDVKATTTDDALATDTDTYASEFVFGTAPTYTSLVINNMIGGNQIMIGLYYHVVIVISDTDGAADITTVTMEFPRLNGGSYDLIWIHATDAVAVTTTVGSVFVIVQNPTHADASNQVVVEFDMIFTPAEPLINNVDVSVAATSVTGGDLATTLVLPDYFNLIPFLDSTPSGGSGSTPSDGGEGDGGVPPEVIPPPVEGGVDSNGDGIPDTWDTNDDGNPDTWDTDSDGIEDTWDTNGDGIPDSFDTDGDGVVDIFDTDGDGTTDTPNVPGIISKNPSGVIAIQNPFGDPLLIYPPFRWTPAQKIGVPFLLGLFALLLIAAIVKKYLDDHKHKNKKLGTVVENTVYKPLKKTAEVKDIKRKYRNY